MRITANPETVRPCKFIGNVVDDERGNLVDGKVGGNVWSTERSLLEKTARLDANTLFFTENFGYSINGPTTQRGEAYRCP